MSYKIPYRIPAECHRFTGNDLDRPCPSFAEVLPDTAEGHMRLNQLRKRYGSVRCDRRQVNANRWAVVVLVVQVYATAEEEGR